MAFEWEDVAIKRDNGEVVTGKAPVIISASRSTDIPAFYAKWLMNRIERGYCVWYNPFNKSKPYYVSFKNAKVFVFWTKNPKPIIPFLKEIDDRGINYYFQFTLNDYDSEGFEPSLPKLEQRIGTFKELSNLIGKDKVVWRFDPLILSDQLTVRDLLKKIWYLGNKLKGFTSKLVFSFADVGAYKKVQNNLIRESSHFSKNNIEKSEFTEENIEEFAQGIVKIKEAWLSENWNVELATCSEKVDLEKYDIKHNRCVDGELIAQLFSTDSDLLYFLRNGRLPEKTIKIFDTIPEKTKDLKDKGQRKECGCIYSKDIGMYDTCSHHCVYCYANTSKKTVKQNAAKHNVFSESIIN